MDLLMTGNLDFFRVYKDRRAYSRLPFALLHIFINMQFSEAKKLYARIAAGEITLADNAGSLLILEKRQ